MKITDLTFIDLKMMFTMFRNDGIMDMINFENKLGSHPYLEGKHNIIKDLITKYDTKDDTQFEELMNVIAKAISEIEHNKVRLCECSKEFIQNITTTIRKVMGDEGVILHSKKAMVKSEEEISKISTSDSKEMRARLAIQLMVIDCQDDFDLLDHYHILRLIGEQL